MRFTTKLSALITLLVALAMFLMLMGCSYSFFYVTQERLERRFEALATSIDQAMLLQPLQAQDNWLPLVMRPLGIVAIHVDTETSNPFLLQPADHQSPLGIAGWLPPKPR
ncbi:Regulator of CsrB and CsrC decay CsrD [Serratia fonticola]|uniref:Regulator of CsrB and CsrC decay CsrD n=1 Tax=Serratia fonticola TaxID=47917 RepID=A0A4U9WA94_SERFO|nr:Regulator of CsrB and CsrC decay CsrD [Serratia fonticola]